MSQHNDAWWWFGALAVTKLATEAVSIVEITEPPGAEAPRHVHHREDEAFVVLEGSVTFEVDGVTLAAGPGDVAFGPRDVPHSYVVGPDGCRMLFVLTPGGFEGMIRATSTPARSLELPPPGEPTPDLGGVDLGAYGCETVDA